MESSRTFRLTGASLVFFSIFLHLYVIARFDSRWLSGDAAIFTKIIESAQESGQLSGTVVYPHGFGYQVLSMFLSDITGIPISSLQVYFYPVLGGLPMLVSYPLFRRLTSSGWTSLLAAFLFGIQSDVLFTSFRSTHEKFTWILTCVVLLFFLLGVSRGSKDRTFATRVGLSLTLYSSLFALFSLNLFFANTFLIILVVAAILGRVSTVSNNSVWSRKLGLVSVTASVLFFSFILYVYEPALVYLGGLASYAQFILVTLLSFEKQSTPQYEYVLASWPSIYVWLALTAATWLIGGLSIVSALRWIRTKKNGGTNGFPTFSLFLFVGAAFVLVLSIIADRFGGFSSNLELRQMPLMILCASPIAARELLNRTRETNPARRRRRVALAVGLLVALVPLSVLKASAEPAVANIRIFVTPGEQAAVLWILHNEFEGRIWTDPTGRLISEAHFHASLAQFPEYISQMQGNESDNYYVLSTNTAFLFPAESARLSEPNDTLIYSNGDVLVFARVLT